MDALCMCCGKQPALPSEAERTQPLQLENVPEELRQILSEQTLNRILTQQFELHMGFCTYCSRAGCDGVHACLVPPHQWSDLENMQRVEAAWMEARQLESIWLRQRSDPVLIPPEQKTIDHWLQITDFYWRKETITPLGKAIAGIFKATQLTGYMVRIHITKSSEAQRPDYWISTENVPTLDEAFVQAEDLTQELIADIPGMISVDIPRVG